MERYHGPDWRSTLEEAEAAAADEEEEAEASREETTKVEGPPGLGSASPGLASSAGTEELRHSIFESHNAGEGVEAFRNRVIEVEARLREKGKATDPRLLRKRLLQVHYESEMEPLDVAQKVRYLQEQMVKELFAA